MQEKIKIIRKKTDELERQLQLPDIINSQEKLKKISIEYNELKNVLEKYDKLKSIQEKLKGAQKILKDYTDDEELKQIAEEEIKILNKQIEGLIAEIELELNPPDPTDKKDVIVEIRAGAGGDESALFAAELFRLYSRYAEKKGWRVQIISRNSIGIGGFKEIIFEINGRDVYSSLKYEMGVHRVQRIPETEKQGRIHTSTATVAVLPEIEKEELKINPGDLRIDVFHSRGHGGQSVNTTDSAVRITHLPTNTVVTCQDEKSQQKNKIKAMKVMRSRLMAAEKEKRQKKLSEKRLSQIGAGTRSEKIRTYNFPQDRITDHRIKRNWSNIDMIMDGNLDIIIDVLKMENKR